MKNKLIFTSFILFFIFLTGCSVKKKVTISFSWWGHENRHEYTLEGIEKFQELHPNINVIPSYGEWTRYEEKFDKAYKENGTADIMQINFDWLYEYSLDGNGFYDLNELSDIIELSNFTLTELEYGMMNGKLNALPTAFNAYIPVYNQTLFLSYGLSVPETWDDLFNAASVMRKDGYYVMGVNRKALFFLTIAWFEQTHKKSVFLDNRTFNLSEDEIEEMILFIKKLVDAKVIYQGFIDFTRADFVENKIASAVSWCSESSQYAQVIEDKGGKAVLGNFISTPGSRNSGWYLKPATMYAIRKDCQHPKQAAEFVNFLLNSEEMALLQKCEKGTPISNKSLATLMENNQVAEMEYLGLMKIRFNKTNINRMLPVMENRDILNSFYDDVMSYISMRTTLKESSSSLYNSINQIISNFD